MLKSLKNCPTEVPSHCFITLEKIELENVRISVPEILGIFVNTSAANNNHPLCNRKEVPQPIELQLAKEQEIFNQFFPAYLRST